MSHPPGSKLSLLSARHAVTFPTAEHHRPLTGTKLYCLMTEAHGCEQLAQGLLRYTQQKISYGISATAAVGCITRTGRCHINFSSVKIRLLRRGLSSNSFDDPLIVCSRPELLDWFDRGPAGVYRAAAAERHVHRCLRPTRPSSTASAVPLPASVNQPHSAITK